MWIVRSFWFKLRFHTQIVIVSTVILAITIIVIAGVNIRQEQINLRQSLLGNAMGLSQSLASTITYNIIDEKYDVIEEILIQLADFPDVELLKVVDISGGVVSHIKISNKNEVQVSYVEKKDTFPLKLKNNQESIHFFSQDSLVVWYPLKTSHVLGWLNVSMTLSRINIEREVMIRNNTISALIAIFIDVLILMFAMSIPARKIKQAIEVAQQLDTVNPHLSNETGGSFEVSKLLSSLNSVAKRLAIQKDSITKHQRDLEAIVDHSPSLIYVKDHSGHYLLINKYYEKIFQVKRKDVIGFTDHDIFPKEFADKFRSNDEKIIASGLAIESDEVVPQNNEILTYHSINFPLYNDAGSIYATCGMSNDITERKRIERELISAKNEALQAVEAKSSFLASMSHEIRTPMNGVLGMLGLVLNSELTSDQKHKINVAQSSAQSLLVLINDIMDVSKVDAGKMDLECLDFNLRNVLGDFAEAMGLQAQAKGLELILDVTQIDDSIVKGDPGRLRQILTNIVGNAIKFTSSGEIAIHAKLHSIDEQLWQFNCRIEDTGLGIPEDKIANLFDSFSQVDASTTRKFGGTGLGLSIAKKLCELMDGDISVSSELDKGSCFTLSIQFKKSNKSQQVLPQVDMQQLNLLVVDDNATNREVLCGQLVHWGATVFEADSGQQALALCDERIHQNDKDFYDIAFVDMQMPGMDGAELGKRLKEDQRFSKMKLIMMTSMGYQGEERYFSDLGFSAYFPKPTTTSDLFDALSVVADGGETLEKAVPLVTKHYLKTLDRSDNNNSSELEKVSFNNARILLVEDNIVNQIVAMGILNGHGFKMVDVAANGLEAITSLQQALEDTPYSVVLMDCQMPDMDGYEASRQIRAGSAGERNKSIPIIALTANSMAGDREKCIEAGMSDYLSKPIVHEDLIEKLHSFLANS